MKVLHSYIEQGLILNIINEYHMFDFSRNINDQKFITDKFISYINELTLINETKN
jgi:hypothetical protein